MSFSLAELAVRFACEIRGDPDIRVRRVASLANATGEDISFLSNPRFRSYLDDTRAAAVIVRSEDAEACPAAMLVCDDPYVIYARIARLLHPEPAFEPGVHETAVVADGARVSASAWVGPQAVIGVEARIGDGVYVGPGCVVAANTVVGEHSRLVARVTIEHDVQIGARCIIHPGAVIGADGFGNARDVDGWVKVPQLGRVLLGDDVEIGANTTVDRGTLGDTVLGNDVKLDNLIQVGHNVVIGDHTAIAACSGIAGSVTIGANCLLAGQTGIAGHLDIADGVTITGKTMVSHSIREPGVYSGGLPADTAAKWRRNAARFRHLDDLVKQVRALARKLQ